MNSVAGRYHRLLVLAIVWGGLAGDPVVGAYPPPYLACNPRPLRCSTNLRQRIQIGLPGSTAASGTALRTGHVVSRANSDLHSCRHQSMIPLSLRL